jgi:DNA-binding NarL/FixJ family response regulator
MSKSIKVLIAEDHDVVREGLKLLISSDPGLKVAGEASSGEAAVRLARKLHPDVVLMDLSMPKGNGLDATREICRDDPHTKVLVLSAYQDEETVQRVMEAGVAGYMTKHSAAEELLTAIRQVDNGTTYYSPKIAGRIRARRQLSFQSGRPVAGPRLTPREQQVLALIARGQPNKEIAYTLELSIKTVEKHRQAAMDKLDIHDIAGLTRYAVSRGLLNSVPTESGSNQPCVSVGS